jgi:protein-tyrosine phosphatase
VKHGLLFRSGSLAKLTASDYAAIQGLGIATVCDFRSASERTAEPTRWQATPEPTMVNLPIGDQKGSVSLSEFARVLRSDPTAAAVRTTMAKFYGQVPIQSADMYATALHEILTTSRPLLFHCTAGKDRTGVFAAILLTTLGANERTGYEDYELTNRYTFDEAQVARMTVGIQRMFAVNKPLSTEVARSLMRAEPEYLRAAFDAIRAHDGSFDNYRRKELHLTDQDVARICDSVLAHA